MPATSAVGGSIGRAGAEAIAVLRLTGGAGLDGLSPEQRACLSMLSLTDLSEANVAQRRELAAIEAEKEALRRESASLRQQLQRLQQQPALAAASPPPDALAVASRLSREQRGLVLRALESRVAAAEQPRPRHAPGMAARELSLNGGGHRSFRQHGVAAQ